MDQDAKIAYLEQLLDREHDPELDSDAVNSEEAPAAHGRRRYPASTPFISVPTRVAPAPTRDIGSRFRDARGPALYFALLALIPLISLALWLLAPPRVSFEEPIREEWAAQPNASPAPATSALPLVQAPAALRVTSDPEDSFVYIDGTLVGISPYLTDTLTAGWRVITLQMGGYATRDTLLYVAPATATTLALTLDSLVADPVPLVEPEQPIAAEPEPEPEPRPAAPVAETTRVPVAESPSQPEASEVPDRPVPDEPPDIAPAPVSETGTLSVLVRPWGTIYVDDAQKAQDTDLRWTADVPVGLRTVRVVHPVLGVQQHTVEVRTNETTSLVIDLY